MNNDEVRIDVVGLTLENAAKLAGVSIPTMQAWVNRRDFPAFRSGRRWIIPRDALIDWIKARAQERAAL